MGESENGFLIPDHMDSSTPKKRTYDDTFHAGAKLLASLGILFSQEKKSCLV